MGIELMIAQKPMDISHPEILEYRSKPMQNFVAFTVQTELCKNAPGGRELMCYAPRPTGDGKSVRDENSSDQHPSLDSREDHQDRSAGADHEDENDDSADDDDDDEDDGDGDDDSDDNNEDDIITPNNNDDQSIQRITIQITDKSLTPDDSEQPLLPLASHELAWPSRWVQTARDGRVRLRAGEALPCGMGLRRPKRTDGSGRDNAPKKRLRLTRRDVRRLERAASYVYGKPTPAAAGQRARRFAEFAPVDSKPFLSDGGNALFQARERRKQGFLAYIFWIVSGISPSSVYKDNGEKTGAALLTVLLPTIYGLLHHQLAVRTSHTKFITSYERQAWYCLSGVLAGFGVINMCMKMMIEIHSRSLLFFKLAFVYLTVLSLLPRLYFTAESFASLRTLPIGAFIMPDGSQLLPHF